MFLRTEYIGSDVQTGKKLFFVKLSTKLYDYQDDDMFHLQGICSKETLRKLLEEFCVCAETTEMVESSLVLSEL
jgi:hypothetical protein